MVAAVAASSQAHMRSQVPEGCSGSGRRRYYLVLEGKIRLEGMHAHVMAMSHGTHRLRAGGCRVDVGCRLSGTLTAVQAWHSALLSVGYGVDVLAVRRPAW